MPIKPRNKEKLDALLTKDEAAKILKCSVSNLNKLIGRGKLSYVKIGHSVRFSPRTLAADFERLTVNAIR